jgi:hypothetical protein
VCRVQTSFNAFLHCCTNGDVVSGLYCTFDFQHIWIMILSCKGIQNSMIMLHEA